MAKRRRISPIKKELDAILAKENEIEAAEASRDERIEKLERETLSEIKELENLEKSISENIKEHPLKKIGRRDLVRGIVGAFAGVIIHNALYYGSEIGAGLDAVRATLLFILAFVVGGLILYATGYRSFENRQMLWIMPLRLVMLYTISLVISAGALFLYLPEFGSHPALAFRELAVVQMSAIIGATTADLIGRTQ